MDLGIFTYPAYIYNLYYTPIIYFFQLHSKISTNLINCNAFYWLFSLFSADSYEELLFYSSVFIKFYTVTFKQLTLDILTAESKRA